jgi:hypothetical protein
MTEAAPVLGVLGAIAGVADMVPYVRDTIRRTTRPHRPTWLIWAVLAAMACASQRADGASWSLVMPVTQAIMTGLVGLLAIPLGTGGLSSAELALSAMAGAGVVGWALTDTPILATAGVVAVDLLAAAMMVPKTLRDPRSETLSTFALASLSGALTAGSVAALDPALLLYPAYFCVANGALSVLIARRRAHLRTEAS